MIFAASTPFLLNISQVCLMLCFPQKFECIFSPLLSSVFHPFHNSSIHNSDQNIMLVICMLQKMHFYCACSLLKNNKQTNKQTNKQKQRMVNLILQVYQPNMDLKYPTGSKQFGSGNTKTPPLLYTVAEDLTDRQTKTPSLALAVYPLATLASLVV